MCIPEDNRSSFILFASPFLQGITAQCQQRLLGPWFLPWRIVRVCEYLASPGCGMLPKRPTSFSPHPEYWVENCMTEGQWEVGKTAARAQNKMYQRDTIPTNNFVDHQEAHPWASGGAAPMDPYSWSTGTSKALHTSPSHNPPHTLPCGQLSVYAPEAARVNLCRWLESTWESLLNSAVLENNNNSNKRKKTHAETWTCKYSPRVGKGWLLVLDLTMQNVQKAYDLKNSPTEENKKYEAGVSIEKIWENLRIPNKANRRVSFLKPVSKD